MFMKYEKKNCNDRTGKIRAVFQLSEYAKERSGGPFSSLSAYGKEKRFMILSLTKQTFFPVAAHRIITKVSQSRRCLCQKIVLILRKCYKRV